MYLGLLLGTEAPVIMPNSADFPLLLYMHVQSNAGSGACSEEARRTPWFCWQHQPH